MSRAKKHVRWCLKKAERELEKGQKHRGLVKIGPDEKLAELHIAKAEHYLKATVYLKKSGFSDISASTAFYAIYHSLLAIAARFGFESRNQQCTFALIRSLIEEGEIDLEQGTIDKIASMDTEKEGEESGMEIRERYQYGTELSMEYNLYRETIELAKEVLSKAKEIILEG